MHDGKACHDIDLDRFYEGFHKGLRPVHGIRHGVRWAELAHFQQNRVDTFGVMVSNHSINIVERRGDALEIQQHRRAQGPLHMGLVQPLSDPLQQFDFLLYFRHDAPRSLVCHNHFEMHKANLPRF